MKVIIFTDAGIKIGFGHAARCLAISEAFAKRNIKSKMFISGDESVARILGDQDYCIYGWLKKKRQVRIKNTDIAVVDSYLADKTFCKEVSYAARKTVFIDDYNRLNYPKGVIVNSSVYAESIPYPRSNSKIYLLGPQYMPLRKELWNVKEKRVNKNLKNILITFGGRGFLNIANDIVSLLNGRFKFNVVDPKNKKYTAKKIVGLMRQADLCISGGGQTIYELARCGLPTIAVCFNDTQLLNIKRWAKLGFLHFAGWHNEENLIGKIKVLIKKLDYAKRLRMSRLGKKIVDGRGAIRIADFLLDKYGM